MVKTTWKEFGLSILLGAGVVLGMALLGKLTFLTGIGFMGFSVIPGMLTAGQALFAGVSAFGMNLLIAQMR